MRARPIIATVAIVSLAVGNLAAIAQRDLKRMLAYSSISHAGFMLIAVAANNELGGQALFYYLIPYAAMSVGAFAVVASRERELGAAVTLERIEGLGWERPYHAAAMWVFMLGFAGFPLTGGFIGKFWVFSAAWEAGWWWLVLAGVLATALSLYYYLRVVGVMYMRPGPDRVRTAPVGGAPPADPALSTAIGIAVVVTIGSFFAAGPLLDLAREAAEVLPFA